MVFTVSSQSEGLAVQDQPNVNLVLSFSLSSSGCSDHLAPPDTVDSAVNGYQGIYSQGPK